MVPFPAKSHYNIASGIFNSLLEAGHELTVVQPFPSKGGNPKRRDIVIDTLLDEMKSKKKLSFSINILQKPIPLTEKAMNPFEFGNKSPIHVEMFLFKMGYMFQDLTFQHKEWQKLMNSGEKFDVCIYEIFALDATVGIGQHFDCHVIAFSTFNAVKWINHLNANPTSHSYVPNPFLSFTAEMTFAQRLWNTVYSHMEDILHELIYYPDQVR